MSNFAEGTLNSDLAARLKMKCPEAFAEVYDLYACALYGFLRRSIPDSSHAEALLQEVFVRMWKEIDHFDPSKLGLFTWIFQLTRQVCDGTQNIRAINV